MILFYENKNALMIDTFNDCISIECLHHIYSNLIHLNFILHEIRHQLKAVLKFNCE